MTIHEAWFAAWNAGDGDAVRSMMLPGGRHYCPGSGLDGLTGEELARFVERGWHVADIDLISATRTPPRNGVPEAPVEYMVITEITVDGHAGYRSVLHLSGDDDSLLVVDHRAFP